MAFGHVPWVSVKTFIHSLCVGGFKLNPHRRLPKWQMPVSQSDREKNPHEKTESSAFQIEGNCSAKHNRGEMDNPFFCAQAQRGQS